MTQAKLAAGIAEVEALWQGPLSVITRGTLTAEACVVGDGGVEKAVALCFFSSGMGLDEGDAGGVDADMDELHRVWFLNRSTQSR